MPINELFSLENQIKLKKEKILFIPSKNVQITTRSKMLT